MGTNRILLGYFKPQIDLATSPVVLRFPPRIRDIRSVKSHALTTARYLIFSTVTAGLVGIIFGIHAGVLLGTTSPQFHLGPAPISMWLYPMETGRGPAGL